MPLTRSGTVLAIILALFACRLALAVVIVPPWQHPDEPSHVARARELARAGGPGSDRDIIQSMAQHQWWALYGAEQPENLPSSIGEVTSGVTGPDAYYRMAGFLFRWLPFQGVLAQLYVLRVVSAFFGILTLLSAWLGSRYMLPEEESFIVPAILAIHPQFALVSTAAGPDAAVNLCGAVVWWQAMRLLSGSIASLATMLAAAALAALTRRVGVPLLVMALLAWFVATVRHVRFGWNQAGRAVVVTVPVLVCAVVAVVFARTQVAELVAVTAPMLSRGVNAQSDWAFFVAFTNVLFESSWLVGGWMRFPAPDTWLMAVRFISALSVVGLVLAWRRDGLGWRPPAKLFVTCAFVAVQLAAVYVWMFRLHIGPQGRYLFPVIAPAAVLFWMGYRSWWSPQRWLTGATVLLCGLALLDIIGWTAVLIPAFLT